MFTTAIIGAGPGGTGALVYAAQAGLLDQWLSQGVALIDRAGSIGGTIGRYIVNSDSLGGVYLECLDAPSARERFAQLRATAAARDLRQMEHGFPPLPLVGAYFRELGAVLRQAIENSTRSTFFSRTEALSLQLCQDGCVAVGTLRDGKPLTVRAQSAVMALGGRPRTPHHPIVAEAARESPDKFILSDLLLTAEGAARARDLLAATREPRAVILGGAHSAYSAAWLLTALMPEIVYGECAVTILSQHSPKIYYPTREEACTDGYAFVDDDVCPRTQRVNRMAGLRGDGRELWRRLTRRRGTEPEPRVRTIALETLGSDVVTRMLNDATVIIPALGYAARTIPVFDASGKRLRLAADDGDVAVDRQTRVLLANGGSLPNVFGIGLGAGYRPHGAMGGEPSFRGQANSLWLYQNHIGKAVYDGVRDVLSRSQMLARVAAD